MLVVGLLLSFAVIASVLYWRRGQPSIPPVINSAGLEPAVERAINHAREKVVRNPKTGLIWGRLGMVLQAHQLPDEALVCYREAERLDPTVPTWPYFQGAILARSAPEAALAHLRRAIALCGSTPDSPRLRLADTLLGLGRGDEAQAQYEELLRDDSQHPLARLGLARWAFQRGNWQETAQQLGRIEDNAYTQKAVHALKAALAQRQGNAAAAERERRICDALGDDRAWPNRFGDEVARLRVDLRSRLTQAAQLTEFDPFEGILALRQLVRDGPDFDPGWRALGFAYLQGKDYAAAQQALTKALELRPESVEAHYYLGCVYFNQRNDAAAIEHLRQATRLKPDYAAAYFQLAQCLERQNDLTGALAAYQQAVRARPFMAAAHLSLGELLAKQGHRQEACAHLTQAVDLDPKSTRARDLLQKLQDTNPAK